MTTERAYWLAWSKISGVGPILLKRIWQQFGSLEQAWQAPINSLRAVEGIGAKNVDAIAQGRTQLHPTQLLTEQLQTNPQFWTPADADYPQLLLEIPSPPPVLYYQGQVNLAENQGKTSLVAIVGTRYPTPHGQKWTQKIATALAQQGFTVVSGMAAGIDGIAHQGCLQAGGRTLAVLGTGVDVIYPANHRQLHQQIQQQGLILSEYPAGTHPERGQFPARNRIIAGLCRAVLVMEAPEKSGSLITARYANEFGRDVYTLPNSPDVEQARGCLRLIHQGAEIIVQEAELLEMLGAIPALSENQQLSLLTPEPTSSPLSPELTTVLAAVTVEAISFDAIVQQTGLSVGEVSATLLSLELEGLITQLPGMRYQKFSP